MDTSERSPEATASPEIAALAPPPQIVGLTDRNQPTVWLYQPIASVRHILLSVREEDSQQFHSQTTIDMPPNSQWVPLQLPEDAPPLAPETTYVWAAIALCGNAPSPNDPTTSTRIRRLDSPASPSETSSPPSIAVAETYARNGQWYDAVDVFVQAQHSTNAGTSELNQTWQAILDYTELGAIAPPLPIPVFEPKPE